jgi:phosphoribosylformimino-5-aminoimidazole carboxamide ribotide isomerase
VQIIPAIDLRGGQCVRLRQGDYAQETVFGSDPAAMARRWVEAGAGYLHLVDLDGARAGRPMNGPSVRAIIGAVTVPCELGGGLRTEEQIAEALGWGLDRVVIGTRALEDHGWFGHICTRFAGRIALGIDAREGMAATDGWSKVSSRSALDLARQCASFPLAALIYTDIRRDGMLEGPNFEALAELKAAVDHPLIASGGITTIEDVRKLAGLALAGCIVGRALYEGQLDLREAITATMSGKP